MFEDLYLNLGGLFRAAVQGTALVMAITLFCGASSVASLVARNPAPDILPAGLEQCIDRGEKSTGTEATHLRFRRGEHRHHTWLAQFAWFELRLEWDSDPGGQTWSAIIQDVEGNQVARAVASAETGKCI